MGLEAGKVLGTLVLSPWESCWGQSEAHRLQENVFTGVACGLRKESPGKGMGQAVGVTQTLKGNGPEKRGQMSECWKTQDSSHTKTIVSDSTL